MNLPACKKNLDVYSGGPVVLNSGREAVKIAEAMANAIKSALDALEKRALPTTDAEVDNMHFRIGWAINSLKTALKKAGLG